MRRLAGLAITQLDTVAEALQPVDQALGGPLSIELVKVICPNSRYVSFRRSM
ncbi:MAG: hypothetical protein M3380_09675 [Chloroflexota bacterium]|nr:hypothetical protein [Chloroflexota bacterium]